MRILFVHNALRSFVRVDHTILASEHEVDELDLSLPTRLATLPLRLARADLVYAWFASFHSLAPVLAARFLRNPSLVVVGGYDTAALPEIGYGSMAHPLKRHMVRLICDSATALLVNSNTALEEVRRNVGTKTPIHMIYHGFEPFRGALHPHREPIVLSVGNISEESLQRKGHQAFADAAALVPEARFILVGRSFDDAGDRLRAAAPANLELPGFLDDAALDELLGRASVYVQASAHEGFGCAVAEALAAGCVPVVSRSGALPEVVGEEGVYLDAVSPETLATAIRHAMHASQHQRFVLANRVMHEFSLHQRHEGLLALVEAVAGRQRERIGAAQ